MFTNTIVQHTTSVNVPLLSNKMPYAKCVLFTFLDLNVPDLQFDVYSIQLKLKELLARIARYFVHVG